jgi:hypothetical protein
MTMPENFPLPLDADEREDLWAKYLLFTLKGIADVITEKARQERFTNDVASVEAELACLAFNRQCYEHANSPKAKQKPSRKKKRNVPKKP